jgi:hypothetical protein
MYLKRFATSIDVDNPVSFCVNIDENILAVVKSEFEGICFKGSYITEVVKITQRSSCKIVCTNLDGGCVIDVEFLARIEMYGKWDIITCMKIEKKENIILGSVAKNISDTKQFSHMTICLKPTKETEIFSVGDYIPVRVIQIYYPPMKKEMVIFGILMTCEKTSAIYYVTDKIPENFSATNSGLINKIKEEMVLRKKIDTKKLTFFENLFHSYDQSSSEIKEVDGWIGPEFKKNSCDLNIFDVLKNESGVSGYWTRNMDIYRSSPYITKLRSPSESNKIINERAEIVFLSYLKNIYNYLVAIREMTELYTDEAIVTHEKLWMAIRKTKIHG